RRHERDRPFLSPRHVWDSDEHLPSVDCARSEYPVLDYLQVRQTARLSARLVVVSYEAACVLRTRGGFPTARRISQAGGGLNAPHDSPMGGVFAPARSLRATTRSRLSGRLHRTYERLVRGRVRRYRPEHIFPLG